MRPLLVHRHGQVESTEQESPLGVFQRTVVLPEAVDVATLAKFAADGIQGCQSARVPRRQGAPNGCQEQAHIDPIVVGYVSATGHWGAGNRERRPRR